MPFVLIPALNVRECTSCGARARDEEHEMAIHMSWCKEREVSTRRR